MRRCNGWQVVLYREGGEVEQLTMRRTHAPDVHAMQPQPAALLQQGCLVAPCPIRYICRDRGISDPRDLSLALALPYPWLWPGLRLHPK